MRKETCEICGRRTYIKNIKSVYAIFVRVQAIPVRM